MATAAAAVPVKELDDVTECSICLSALTDARGLPCIHTFCLKCLQDYAKNNQPEDKVPCPFCREDFTIPKGGLAKLPRNYFVEKVLEVKKFASRFSRLSHDDVECCELCSEENDSLNRNPEKRAVTFCTDCSQNMCKQCFRGHKKCKATASHKTVGLNEGHDAEDLMSKFPENRCEKHSDEITKLYCRECKLAVCMMCFVKDHKTHDCVDVKEVADELSKQLDGDIIGLRKTDDECSTLTKKVEDDKKEFKGEIEKVRQAVSSEAVKLHSLINRYKQEVLNELSQVEKTQCKKMESMRDEAELHSVKIKNFMQYGTTLRQKGTACDIAKLASSLRERATGLGQFDPDTDYNIKVTFEGRSSYDEVKRVFGELDADADDFVRSKSAKLLFEIPRPMNGKSVCGVATFDNELFVSRCGIPQIQVYNATTGAHVSLRDIPIPDASICGLVACGFFRCLYFVAISIGGVYKLSLTGNSTAMNASPLGGQTASVIGQACGLSVNRHHNLLVARYAAHKLHEYTTDGVLVREVNLQPHIIYPLQAVELHSGLYGVIHLGPTGGYSVVDRQGQVVRNFSDEKSLAQLRRTINPSHLPTTNFMPGYSLMEYRKGRVFIANQSDSKILVFHESGKSEFLPDIISDALNVPSCMHYDASTKKLYIGEWSGFRVLCFGLKSTETS